MIITPAEPHDVTKLLAFREEAAAWLRSLGSDQWSRPYPADKLLATIEAGTVFMLRDGHTTAGTITLTPDAEEGLWTDDELTEPSMFVNKLTTAREYAGQDLGAGCSTGPVTVHIVRVLDGSAWMPGRRTRGSSGTTSRTASHMFVPSARVRQ